MRFFFQQRTPGRIEFGVIYGGIALLSLFAARFPPVLKHLPPCAFQGFTGYPCPTCGATRSAALLAQGDLRASMIMSPLASLCFLAAVFCFLYGLIALLTRMPRVGIALSEQERRVARGSAVAIALLNWGYLILMR